MKLYDCSILQVNISSVNIWCETCHMNFNCKHLRITKKRNPVCATYHPGTDVLTLSQEEKDLRIIMSRNLSWCDHIMLKVNTANRMLGIIKRTCGRRPLSNVFLKLYIYLVRPHLEYACEVWSPQQAYLVDILERVQRRATTVITKHKPYGERLKDLKLLSLSLIHI